MILRDPHYWASIKAAAEAVLASPRNPSPTAGCWKTPKPGECLHWLLSLGERVEFNTQGDDCPEFSPTTLGVLVSVGPCPDHRVTIKADSGMTCSGVAWHNCWAAAEDGGRVPVAEDDEAFMASLKGVS